MPLIFKALARIYEGEILSPVPPYQLFIEHVARCDRSKSEKFWKEQFSDFDAQRFPALPSTTYRPKCDEHLQVEIDQTTSDGTFTRLTMIRAAWAILLSSITNSADASFGATVSGRQVGIPGIEQMTGPTTATVPLRLRVDRSKPVRELLHQVQTQAIEMTPFEHFGLHRIQKLSDDCNLGCQFQSLMVIQPGLSSGSTDELLETPTKTQSTGDADPFKLYAICLEIFLCKDKVIFCANYDSNVAPKAQFCRLVERFERVLNQIALSDVQTGSLAQVVTTSPMDLVQIWKWNKDPLEASNQTVHEIFSVIAAKQPHAPAVCSWDGEFTYGQVEELSTRIAHGLLQAGLPQSGQRIVPIFFEKSKWTPVCQVAVMKANGTSVTLDMTLPDGRLP